MRDLRQHHRRAGFQSACHARRTRTTCRTRCEVARGEGDAREPRARLRDEERRAVPHARIELTLVSRAVSPGVDARTLHLASPKLTVVNTLGGVHHASKAISLATVPLPGVAISSRGQAPPEALRMAMRDFAGVSGAILQCKARERLLTHSRTRPCRRIRRTRLRWA